MPKTIFDYVNAPVIAAYVNELGSNQIPYLGELLFPAKKKVGIDLKWIKTHSSLPVALANGAFDAKAPLRDRMGLTISETKMPFFREAIRIGEEERQNLLTFMAANMDSSVKTAVQKIYDDANNLVAGVDVDAERMRMQLLSTGKISIVDKTGLHRDFDYKFNTKHIQAKLTSTNAWSNAAAPVTEQIESWIDIIESDTGVRPTRAICSRKTFNYLKKNTEILTELKPLLTASTPITDAQLKNWFNEKFRLQVSVYTKKYLIVAGGESQQFFPDNVFTLLPPGNIGNTWFGTTPEEADLMTGQIGASVSIVKTGVAITTYKEIHPVNAKTIVSAIMLPSFESSETVFIANVA